MSVLITINDDAILMQSAIFTFEAQTGNRTLPRKQQQSCFSVTFAIFIKKKSGLEV